KPRRYSEVFRGSKRDAERRERELRGQLDNNLFVDPRVGTVADYLERWLADYCPAAVTERTLHRYTLIVRLHLIPRLGHRKLAELSPLDIEEAKRFWLEEGSRRTPGKGLHPQTVKHHLTVLHSALRQAVRWRLLSWNPCDAVGNVKVPRARKQALDVDEANMLIEALKDHELGRLFRLAMVTGMRPGEYLGLRWADVDLKSKRLTVRQGVWQRNRKDVRVVGVKSHRSERPISLTDGEVELLKAQWRAQERERSVAGDAWEDWGLVFADPGGRPLDYYRVRRDFRSLLESAGLPEVTPYSLRRTMASIMHALGYPAGTIAARMGHADTQVLFRHYIKEFEEQDREAAEGMAAALRGRQRTRSALETAEEG
ncbi:MAG: site-specific integrase, partial [Candidatus Dormibacteraeota bacterium]|nr:site-specific integrase [Candidatus Dormibacteraeota bacterium]